MPVALILLLLFLGDMIITDIMENAYNRRQRPSDPKFKLWSSVGIMLTYRCPAACACCYVFSAPDINCPGGEMDPEMAWNCWQATRELNGQAGSVHLTGGEPFLRYELLRDLLQKAYDSGIGGLEKIETNAAWCVNDQITRERIGELAKLGLTKLQISTDVYHQQFVPTDNLQRAIRIASEILGPERLQVRWRDFANDPVRSELMSEDELDEAFTHALDKIPERMVGRAAVRLSHLVNQQLYSSFKGTDCRKSHIAAKGVHIDGFGNVFSSTCIGIITGKVDKDYSLKDVWVNYDFTQHPIWAVLTEGGPWLLAENARERGFVPAEKYAGKCHLCYSVRKWLFTNDLFPDHLGPAVCYGQ